MVTNLLPVKYFKGNFIVTIEDRLKEERGRLGLNQPDFAALAGRTKKTLIDYEKGSTSPDAKFLAAIAAIGADVQYILTGKRSLNPLGNSGDVSYRLYMVKSSTETVEALGLAGSDFGENLASILFFVGLGKTKDENDVKSEAQSVIEVMQSYADSNLTLAEKDLLAAYRKAAQPDKAFMERLIKLTAKAMEGEG